MGFVNNYEDFIKFHAQQAGMTREEWIAHYGVAEGNAKPGPDAYMTGLSDDEEEKKKEKMKKQAEMDDDDPDAYKELPGDKEAREEGKVKKSKHVTAYHRLYGEDLDESTMSDIHQMAGEAKSKEDFLKMFFKEYGAKVKKTKDSEEWAASLYDDMNESKVNERSAMGFDAMTGLYYFDGVPFTQDRLDQVIGWLKGTTIKAGKSLPKQFTYKPAIQIEDEVGGEQVTFDTDKIKFLEYIKKTMKGKLASDADFNESNQITEAEHSGSEASDKMAFSQLERIIDYATMIRDRMAAGKGLDAWMYGKVIKAEDYLNTLFDVIDGDDGVVETQQMTKKEWKKIKKFNKHVTDSGEKFVMNYNDMIGTFLEPVEIVDEATVTLHDLELDGRQQKNFDKHLKKHNIKIDKEEINSGGHTEITYSAQSKEDLMFLFKAAGGYYPDGGVQWITEAKAVKRFDKKLIDPNFQVHQEGTLRTIYKGVSGNVDVEVSDKFIELKGLEDIPEDWRGQHIGRFYQLKRNLYLWAKDMEDTRTGRAAVDEFGDAFFNVMSIFTIDGDEISILWDRPSNFKAATYGGPGVNLQYESVVNEEKAEGDRGPIDNPDIETALKKKADDTGVPIGLIRIVMRRGMAAWKTGHRPGAGQEQWGYARVNSFLTKQPGTWGDADSDVAKEVRDGGHDSKLKKA